MSFASAAIWLSTVIGDLGCLAASEVRRSKRVSFEQFAEKNNTWDWCLVSSELLRESMPTLEEHSPSSFHYSAFVLWYCDPGQNWNLKLLHIFHLRAQQSLFWPATTLTTRVFFPLKKRKGTGETFGFKTGAILLIFPTNWHLSIICSLYWTIFFPPVGISYHFGVMVRRNSSSAYRQKLSLLIKTNIFI